MSIASFLFDNIVALLFLLKCISLLVLLLSSGQQIYLRVIILEWLFMKVKKLFIALSPLAFIVSTTFTYEFSIVF